ncbi:MAG TPA: 2-dehydro-3-deoxy-6-phosphogalactonate aldolase [Rhizomicrobium sp.]|jgi:2-dehydro-3-deoxyphosphogalactonate aldolase|nr:2-dehydro-3-deoxy-6-phosphogalactonate aldolase [Rhizomicrobium sp.]
MNDDWWKRLLSDLPLIAILRGLRPEEAVEIGDALVAAGILAAEVPLNSPDAPESISRMRMAFGETLAVGAGTVLSPQDVAVIRDAGAQFVVSPNANSAVISATKKAGMLSMPGFATPSEAFAALEAGADGLKLFPAEASSPAVLKALKEVLPGPVPVFPVGGITPDKTEAYRRAGAAGFGIGSAIYRAGRDAKTVKDNASASVKAWRDFRPR